MSSIHETLARGDLKKRRVNTKGKLRALGAAFSSSPVKIWSSKVSRRVALAAFMTILLVQTVVLNLGGIENYRQERLLALREQARSSIASIIDRRKGGEHVPFDAYQVDRMISATVIRGISVYSYKADFIAQFGSAPVLIPKMNMLDAVRVSNDGNLYEVVFKSSDILSTFIVVAQLDSGSVREEIEYFVVRNIWIMIILSLLVTNVLMIALGKWLLEPLLFMRADLVAAFKNPEAPEIQDSPYDPADEVGAAIDLMQKLILQNAENLTHLKSTAEDKIHRLAYYDTLTGLPNRSYFVQQLSVQAKDIIAEDVSRKFAVITLDLDHFKDINDSMGHNVGDAILRSVGKKLRSSLPESAVVSRTGEDEFALMMPLPADNVTSRDVAERVLGVIRSSPFKVFNEEFQVRASVGVATYPDDGIDPDMVLKNADIALNRAKEDGRDTIKEYSEDFDRAVQERFQMLRDLRDALEHDQLQLFFQPQLDLRTGKLIGAEALLRWWKPDNSKEGGSFISPATFIPVAEQSGLIVPIGCWVLQKACQIAMKIRNEHGLNIRIAVNVSGNQFTQSDIVANVEDVLKETGLEPNMLELEVTESVFMDDIQQTVQILHRLHSLGIELAIDDFGTGYSSLSYLSQFPIDRLKIDQSFIRNALNDKDNASIARTIINLGHSLDLKVIAEGVEGKEHEEFLIAHGCDEVQGFRYSRPVPYEKFVEFAKNYNGDLSSFN